MNKVEIKSTGPVEVTVNGSKYEEKGWPELPWGATYYGGGFNQTYPSAWSVEVGVKPSYDRQQALRGEHKAPLGKYSYVLLPDGRIKHVYKFGRGIIDGEFLEFERIGCKFFPTRELAEEFKLIAEGKWRPSHSDTIYALCRDTLRVPPGGNKMLSDCDDLMMSLFAYFPSESQRSSYIESKKPKMPTVEYLRGMDTRSAVWPANPKFTVEYQFPQPEFEESKWRWLDAVFKSRAYANEIRKAEKARGETGNLLYYVEYDPDSQEFDVECNGVNLQEVGCEYFYTEEGAELYKSAMGQDIKHLING